LFNPSAALHVIKTTEQMRLGYDASNYVSFSMSSGGVLTLDFLKAGFSQYLTLQATNFGGRSDSVVISSEQDMDIDFSGGYSLRIKLLPSDTIPLHFAYSGFSVGEYLVMGRTTGDIPWIQGRTGGGFARQILLNPAGGNIGIGVPVGTSPSAALHIMKTSEQLRVGYDASNYSSFEVNSSGFLTISPTGSVCTITPSNSASDSAYLILNNPDSLTTGANNISSLGIASNNVTVASIFVYPAGFGADVIFSIGTTGSVDGTNSRGFQFQCSNSGSAVIGTGIHSSGQLQIYQTFTNETITPTHTLILRDTSGNQWKVPVQAV